MSTSTRSADASLGSALARGASWRYFVLFVAAMLVPAASALAPLHAFFKNLFDLTPRSETLIASLDSPAFVEVVRQLGEPEGEKVTVGLFGFLLTTAILAPLLAGAAVTNAREEEGANFRSLFAGAASYYPRMLRMTFASLIPLGIAGAGAALAFHLADNSGERALTEAAASHASQAATFASILLFWIANALVESGRAHFAADDERRSALVALWSGAKLAARRPGAVFGLCFVTTVLGVGIAAVVTAIRLRLPQTGTGSIVVAFVIAQTAIVSLAWGRSSKIAGLAALIRAHERA